MLEMFKRSEDQERGADPWHGTGGPLAVSDDRTDFAISPKFIEAAQNYGLPFLEDCNRGDPEGVGYYQVMIKNGMRSSTATGLRRLAKGRKNLTIVPKAHCEKIIIEDGRARGVQYRKKNGGSLLANALKEVIISAGAIGSPQRLMLSGIGPGDHLRGLDIPVIAHNPEVGANLKDHLKIHNSYEVTIPTLNDRLNSWFGKIGIALEYAFTRRGPMTMAAAPVFCFARSKPGLEAPDIQFHVLPWSSSEPSKGIMHPFSGFTASICPVKPESRGRITLRSPDAKDAPLIAANYLASEKDRQTAIDGLKLSRAIAARSPLRDLIVREFAPGPDCQTEEDLLAYVRANASTIFHPVGTCRMGSDQNAVVDPRLRVRGVEGLRVADASIMPDITSGNTNAPTAAIAEKASDLIRADWRT